DAAPGLAGHRRGADTARLDGRGAGVLLRQQNISSIIVPADGPPIGGPYEREGRRMRTIVGGSDRLGYVGALVVADYAALAPAGARAAMDGFVARYRGAGWRVVDHRQEAASAA